MLYSMIFDLLLLFASTLGAVGLQTVSIRGNLRVELLPTALTSSWNTWTFDDFGLNAVESDNTDSDREVGWLNPVSRC